MFSQSAIVKYERYIYDGFGVLEVSFMQVYELKCTLNEWNTSWTLIQVFLCHFGINDFSSSRPERRVPCQTSD